MKLLGKSQSGFSLIEVMLAGALLAGLGIAFMKLMGNQTKSLKSVEASSEIESTISRIQKILNSPNGCNATLAARTLKVFPKTGQDYLDDAGVTLSSIRINESNDLLSVGQSINKSVDLLDIRVKLDTNNFDPETGYGLGEVILSFGKKGEVYGGKDVVKSASFYAKFTAFRYYTYPTGDESVAKDKIGTKCKADMGYSDVAVKILKLNSNVALGECLPKTPTELYVQDCD